jgi:hypothetical protein
MYSSEVLIEFLQSEIKAFKKMLELFLCNITKSQMKDMVWQNSHYYNTLNDDKANEIFDLAMAMREFSVKQENLEN